MSVTMYTASKADAPGASRITNSLWVLPVLLSAWCFHSITGNYFYGDDLYNLYEIANRGLVEYLVKPYGSHLLGVRNIVFYSCYRLFGTNPEPYFWIVLLTHLLNVFLVFDILRLFRGPKLACLGATLWGASPLDEGALGWFSVYGQVLATTFILWVLRRLAQVAAGDAPRPLAPLRWAGLLLAASMSFGTGIGAAIAFPAVALILLPPSPTRRRAVTAFVAVAVLVPLLYLSLHRIAQVYHAPPTGWMGSPLLALHLWQATLRSGIDLTIYGLASLPLGLFWYPVPYPSAIAYAVAATFAVGVGAALALGNGAARRQLLASTVLGLACYGIIVVGRVPFFAMKTSLILSPRYHYAAMAMLCIAVFVIVSVVARARPLPLPSAAWAVALALVVVPRILIPHPIDHHDRERKAAERALHDIYGRVAASPPGANVFIPNKRFTGVGPLMMRRLDLFPGLAGVFAVYFPDSVVDGRHVFFVFDDAQALAMARRGRKTARFVLGPGEEPPAVESTGSNSSP